MTVTRHPDLDPGMRALLEAMDAFGAPPLHTQTPDEARAAMRVMTVDLRDPATVAQVGSADDRAVPGPAGEVPVRVYRPAGPDGSPRTDPLPTVVYLHGGGFVIGDLDTHDALCRWLARDVEAVVVSVDYRLAPEHPFPAAVEDCLAAVEWADDHRAELGGADQPLAVGGDSAGGNLTCVVTQAWAATGRAPLAAQLLVYPAVDAAGDYPSRSENGTGYLLDTDLKAWFITSYAGTDPDAWADPRISPLRGELAGLPPAVVVTAGFDPLRDEGDAYARALADAGVEVHHARHDTLIHGFADMTAGSPVAHDAVASAFAAFRGLLHPSPSPDA